MVKRETLAKSVLKRNIELLTITTNDKDQEPKNLNEQEHKARRVVVVLGRVHPGESPSSFVCQGLLDFLVSAHPIAKVLRDYLVFKIIPMLNPDGVYYGNYRYQLFFQKLFKQLL